jgi:3-hydroxymyristoyl/3-hydroxydecanoyl-(acyl carrier protein) dehydratase
MPDQAVNGRFAAFSFVDRITEIDGLRRVTGRFTLSPEVTYFPVSLVAEAIGQLAAWVAMSHVDFKFRPVAALAGDTRIFKIPQPGDTLELEVDIESCDEQAIVYRGRARIKQEIVLELLDTLGSMLDINEFDAPESLRADFACLTSTGRTPGVFLAVPQPLLTEIPADQGCEFELSVPEQAAFFDDHFPSRPVFPATLLIDALLRVAQPYAEKVAGTQLTATRITNVKVRAFTPPGTTLVLFAQPPEAVAGEPYTWRVKVGARSAGKVIAGARLYFSSTSSLESDL